jgi:hypothetical protein
MARPQSLAEVAAVARANRSDFAMALDEFVDEFYLDHPDKAAQQVRLDPIPEPVGDPLADAWIGAVGEHLALRWGLRTPDWTQRAVHFALEEPHFLPDARALRDLIIVESPPASGVCPLSTCRTIRSRPSGVSRAFLCMFIRSS